MRNHKTTDLNGITYNLINEMTAHLCNYILQEKLGNHTHIYITSSNAVKLENAKVEIDSTGIDFEKWQDDALSKMYYVEGKKSDKIVYLYEWDGFAEMAKISLKTEKVLSLTVYTPGPEFDTISMGVSGENARILVDASNSKGKDAYELYLESLEEGGLTV